MLDLRSSRSSRSRARVGAPTTRTCAIEAESADGSKQLEAAPHTDASSRAATRATAASSPSPASGRPRRARPARAPRATLASSASMSVGAVPTWAARNSFSRGMPNSSPCGVVRLGHAVGVEAEQVARRERELRGAVGLAGKERQRQAVRAELLDRAVGAQQEARVVARRWCTRSRRSRARGSAGRT